ncbi:MAG: allophanate hydrolase [Pseudoxanthomonas sp.]
MTAPLTFAALRGAYAEARTTPRRLIAELRERAAQLDGEYRLFIHLLDQAELEPYLARLDGADPASLPLYGLPFAIKDNIDLAAVPTTAGCPDFAYLPAQSATVVQRLLELGAIPLGKTNLDQFATGLNGTRSPYGECRNAVLPEYISGGSSSGSAVALALGLCAFALGTDTAGSGRVPAALNGLVGTKPTCGILSARGMVPACRSLDTISLFTARAEDASELLGHLAALPPDEAYGRHNAAWNGRAGFGAPRPFRFGVPRAADLEWLGCEQGPQLFLQAVQALEAIGGTPVEIDFAPFLEAARMVYDGPWVAERHAAVGDFIASRPDAVFPVVGKIIGEAGALSASGYFAAEARRRELKQACDALLQDVDLALSPTIARAFTREQLRTEPIARNSELGIYTNFMNLLDYAAVAVPTGALADGLPWGVSLFGRAFTDQYLLSVAHALQLHLEGAGAAAAAPAAHDHASVVVCGAHLAGQPLNWQLAGRGGSLLRATRTAARYRLHALAGGPPLRPGLVRSDDGAAIEVEVWRLPKTELGHFLLGIPAPLGLGKVELEDGSWETGFICEPCGLAGARDITGYGGWRAFLQAGGGAG